MRSVNRRVLAVIPARGGSKGVPAKNLACVGGVPLVARAVRECRASRLVTDVVVSTDDPGIAAVARGSGAEVVERPADISGDTASSEAAVLHALDTYEARHGISCDVVLLVQCTSPFVLREDVDGVAGAVLEDGADTALTVARFHGFLWRDDGADQADAAGAVAAGAAARVDVGLAGADLAAAGAVAAGAAATEGAAVPGAAGTVAQGAVARAAVARAGAQAAPLTGPAATPAAAGPSAVTTADPASAADRVTAPDPATAADRDAAPDAASASDAAAGTTAREPAAGPRGGGAGGYGVNHDRSYRPRRQDRPEDLLETGAAYAMRAERFRAEKHRFFGRTALVRTDAGRVLEIDEPHDLARARALAPLIDTASPGTLPDPRPTHLPTRDDVDAVVLDFDGTQTDDRVWVDAEGRELVAVHRGDGLGVAALRRAGLAVLILSTEVHPVVAARARKLDVPVLHGVDRKDVALKQWCEEHGIPPERVLYVGNDVNDLPCFGLVGWPVAVATAHQVVRDAARAVTRAPGGQGAVREIASWLLGKELSPSP